jgi:hypothetical protein
MPEACDGCDLWSWVFGKRMKSRAVRGIKDIAPRKKITVRVVGSGEHLNFPKESHTKAMIPSTAPRIPP